MPSYLVETYLSRGRAGERASRERRARSAAEEQTRTGTRVRFDGLLNLLTLLEQLGAIERLRMVSA